MSRERPKLAKETIRLNRLLLRFIQGELFAGAKNISGENKKAALSFADFKVARENSP
jgi:hypothetical protein